MNKRILYILITGICISLAGIIAVQFFWISNAFRVREAQFARSVNDALGDVVGKMEAHENMSFISRNFEGDSILQIVQAFTRDTGSVIRDRLDSLLTLNEIPVVRDRRDAPPPPPRNRPPAQAVVRQAPGMMHYSYQFNMVPSPVTSDSFELRLEEFYHEMQGMDPMGMTFEWNDQVAMLDSMLNIRMEQYNRDLEGPPENLPVTENNEIIIEHPYAGGKSVIRYSIPANVHPNPAPGTRPDDRRREQEREANIQKLDNKAKKIQDVIKQIAIALETKPAPIQQRINKKSLQASLGKSFREKGIDMPFEFAVYSPSSDSNHLPIRSTGFKEEYASSGHRVSLFPNDLFQKPDMLMVYFPGQKSKVIRSLSWLLIGSALFTLIILLSSGGSIVVMIRQKKISDIKTDFINNMTHEFKTPIATISIAADSINNPRVISEPDTIRNFTRIIKEENNRMNARVEQVLQMALLDSHDFKLSPKIFDLNQLIQKAVENYRLQVEKRDGIITTRLEAVHSLVHADPDHLRNVLMNLLDNAVKYSLAQPDIVVFSLNRSGKYLFGVQDRGLGMSPEAQRKVFDKFYRVTSGNIHNIKGFGLGLSYVKAIVLAHRGEIRVYSELGRGSRFEISLPFIPENQSTEQDHNPKM